MKEFNEIKPGVELKFRYGMAAPDSRPGFKGYHWGDVRVLSVRGQNVDLEQKQAGEWRNNGLVSSIPYLQRMQNEYEKQMGTKYKLSETKKTMKKSELRQIIREEIQKEMFGLQKHMVKNQQMQKIYEIADLIDGIPGKTEKYRYWKSSSNRPTMILDLSKEGFDFLIKKGVFDSNGKILDKEFESYGYGNYAWTLDILADKPLKYVDGDLAYPVYGHSGDSSFGRSPWFMEKRLTGNIKPAREIFTKFIKKHLMEK